MTDRERNQTKNKENENGKVKRMSNRQKGETEKCGREEERKRKKS